MFQYFLFTYRRNARRWRRQARTIRRAVEVYINRYIVGKWHQLALVRRLLVVWFCIIMVMFVGLEWQTGALKRLALVAQPLPGGTFREAAVGSVTILNPVLPQNDASADLNRLIYSGLTQYDNHRHLVADLASSWEVSTDGKSYTFHLRRGVTWQDGVPFTSADVLFTLAAIQNPDSRSPLAASWQGVTAAAPDDHTVIFSLPTPFTPFIDSTTVGIVPRHLLESIEPSQLRETSFNQAPIGTGPFKLTSFALKAGEISLTANPSYYAGKPKLDGFTFTFYDSDAAALQAYIKHDVDAVGRIQSDTLPQAQRLSNLALPQFDLPTETTLFFRLGDPTLADVHLRSALVRALDRNKITSQLGSLGAIAETQPILPGQLGYTAKYFNLAYDPKAASAALTSAGWTRDRNGILVKDGQPLKLTLVTLAGSDYEQVAKEIQRQWKAIGVDLRLNSVDLEQLQQTYIRPRNFQLLLYGLSIGADPDVYAFWHSSQAADPGLNLSQYNSTAADRALESGRIKQDPQIRQGKYEAFLQAWNTDVPAAVLYSTPYLYGVSQSAFGIQAGNIVVPADRFYGVQHWTIRTRFGHR